MDSLLAGLFITARLFFWKTNTDTNEAQYDINTAEQAFRKEGNKRDWACMGSFHAIQTTDLLLTCTTNTATLIPLLIQL